MNHSRIAILGLAVALLVPVAWAAPAPAKPAPATQKSSTSAPAPSAGAHKPNNRPLPAGETAAVVHAPYGGGDCGFCHVSNDRKNPGPLTKKVNALCFECHQEFEDIMARKYKHPPATESCTNCHNPHDSKQKKLLHSELASQCLDCHPKLKAVALESKVKHGALTDGQKCANCHNPHGTNVEKLLIALPYDLCVSCHGVDGVKDWNGTPLTNFKKLLADNKVVHAPIEGKDCSACHKTHGADTFRLLVSEYPARFYAPYDLKNYELCFGCHNDTVAKEPQTTTLTQFRDGARNLHFVHVNKAERGRTCRACHEVHAAKQDHQIRDAVPYGPRNWMLKVGYTKTPTGGSCARTCHDTKNYVNKTVATTATKK